MKHLATLLLLALAAHATPALAEEPSTPDECGALAALDFTEAVGAKVELRATLEPAKDGLPARCWVDAFIAPEIGVVVWLPVKDWNNKVFVAGCYGYCGTLRTDRMEDAAIRGYVTATTNGGHSDEKYGGSGWALDNTALEDDFGHRAVHVTTVLAKALTEAYYGNRETHAYFRGCSTGGRQGLVAASRYPDDFDGIIAGAPFNPQYTVPYMIWADQANTGPDGATILTKPKLELLQKAALAACDAGDGLLDGIVGDPEHCDFRPDTLACARGKTEGCLTRTELDAVRKIYDGPGKRKGRVVFPRGLAPGSEGGWDIGLTGLGGRPPPYRQIGQEWLHYHAFEPDPPPPPSPVAGDKDKDKQKDKPKDAAPLRFDFDKDPARLAASVGRLGFGTDLGRFAAGEGKLIVWHGWADQSIPPAQTLGWWQAAQKDSGGAEAFGEYARLYMLPGVQHCGGGAGGGDVDFLAALERWVENDSPPGRLVMTRTKDSTSQGVRQPRFPPAEPAELTRPVYPYPGIARYDGKGDPQDPASYAPENPH